MKKLLSVAFLTLMLCSTGLLARPDYAQSTATPKPPECDSTPASCEGSGDICNDTSLYGTCGRYRCANDVVQVKECNSDCKTQCGKWRAVKTDSKR